MNKQIAIILGTRPEAVKLLPVFLEFKKRNIKVDLISTGQHGFMLQQIFQFFDVAPDESLDVMVHNQSLSELTARLIVSLEESLSRQKYNLIIVQGDTTTAMAASLVAFYNKVRIAHIEAGLRTYDKFSPYPEEINRQIISRIGDFHFAPTTNAANVLKKEKVSNIFNVGNTVIDSLLYSLDRVKANGRYYEERFQIVNNFQKLVLITGHRRENFGAGFEGICNAIKNLSTRYPDILFYYPVHLNPNVKDKVHELLSGHFNIYLDQPLPYDELIFLMSKSFIILTDSGGIQEEAPSLDVPVLVMRDTTERPEGVANGCSVLVGVDCSTIIKTFDSLVDQPGLYSKMANAINPYGDGKSSKKIVDILCNELQLV